MRLLMPVGRSGRAIVAGSLGLFGFLIIPAPLTLIASIIAIIAIIHIRKSMSTANPKHGMGRAIFGLIIGLLGTVALGVFLVTQFVIP